MRRAGRRGTVDVVAATLAAIALLASASAAGAAPLCTGGAAPGQCSSPRGLAVDSSSDATFGGRTYLADWGNNRIDVFDKNNNFAFSFAGSGSSQLSLPTSVAVDSSSHNIYVTDFGNRRIEKFGPNGEFLLAFGEGEYEKEGAEITERMLVATAPGGEVYVVDVRRSAKEVPGDEKMLTTRLRRYAASGGAPVFEKDIVSVERGSSAGGNLRGLAVDSAGNAYVRNFTPGESLCKYDPAGEKVTSWREGGCMPARVDGLPEAVGVTVLAVAGPDHLFAWGFDFDAGKNDYSVITEYDAAGTVLRRVAYTSSAFAEGLVIHPGGLGPVPGGLGPVYASVGEEVRIIPFPPPGPIAIDPKPEGVVLSFKAALRAEVNPEGQETDYVFQYLTQEEFENQGGFIGPATKETSPKKLPAGVRLSRAEALVGCVDPAKEAAEGKCLSPETKYRWRIVATNAGGGGEGTIEGPPFTTPKPLEVIDTWSTAVGVDSAGLHATVNPLGAQATGFFEVVAETSFQKSGFDEAIQVPDVQGGQAPLDFGAGTSPVSRSATAFPLEAGKTYRFRLVTGSPLLADPEIGQERTLTTFAKSTPVGCAAEGLRGGLIGARSGPSAFLPDCRAYELVSPLEKNNADIVYRRDDVENLPATLEQSAVDGGRMAYTALVAFGEPDGAPYVSQYVSVRRPGEAWESHDLSSQRKRLLARGLAQFDTEFEAFSTDLCDGWLRPVSDPPLAEGAVEGNLNLYRRRDEECGGKSYLALTTSPPPHLVPTFYALELQGVSADGERVIYRGNDTLAGTGAPPEPSNCSSSEAFNCKLRLYSQSAAEGSRYVCILPNNTAAPSCAAGTSTENNIAQRSRASSIENAISIDGSRIFWTTPAPDEGQIYMRDSRSTTKASDDTTTAVSAPGEALSGTGKSRYWCAADDGSKAVFSTGGDLYEFYPKGAVTHRIAGDLVGVAGCDADASRIYFGSEEVLSGTNVEEENSEGEKAVASEPNLYFYEAAGKAGDPGSYAFVGTLAGSDIVNIGSFSPLSATPVRRLARVTPDGGVLAFMSAAPLTDFDNSDAATGVRDMEVFLYEAGSGELACASCNPTGARPVGSGTNGSLVPAAGSIPGWENPLYAARALSDEGRRLFFESADKLAARDIDGRVDVYEWEEVGEGSCSKDSTSYSLITEGCVYLISSGQEERDAEFRDASPSGDDVFFATQASLLPQDYGLVDIYDARVGGGLPVPPPREPPCEGDACQPPAVTPIPPTPGSSSYAGPGNLPASAGRKSCPRGKRLVRRKTKARCVKSRKRQRPQKERGRR